MTMLDARERARAERFRFGRDREWYVARHLFLRRVLAGYLQRAPGDIVFRIAPEGKPALDESWGIDFNTSHSAGMAVVAVTRSGRVGVDIERVRTLDDALELGAACLTAREQRLIRGLPAASRSRGFLELWTGKEATLKALGVGLAIPPASFDCGEVDADGARRPRGLPGDPRFSLVTMGGIDGHIVSVALASERVSVRHRSVSEVAP
jgi:4'-phosphopantetheinyl transferase